MSSVVVPPIPIFSLLAYSQRLCQRQSFDADSLEQIPFFTASLIRSLKKCKIDSINHLLSLFSVSDGDENQNKGGNKNENKRENEKNSNDDKELAIKAEEIIISELKQNTRALSDINEFISSVSDVQIVITRDSKIVTKTRAKEGDTIKLKLLIRRLNRIGIVGQNIAKNLKNRENDYGKHGENVKNAGKNDKINEKNDKNTENGENTENIEEKNDKNLKLIVKNKPKSKAQRKLAHCPFLPVDKEEQWALLVTPESGTAIVSSKWLNLSSHGFDEVDLEIPAFARQNSNSPRFVDIAVVSDSYVGVMKTVRFSYDVDNAEEGHKEEEEAPNKLNKCITDDLARGMAESEEDEMPKDLADEAEESLFSVTWCDLVLIPITAAVFLLVFPETDMGHAVVVKVRGVFSRLVSAFRRNRGV